MYARTAVPVAGPGVAEASLIDGFISGVLDPNNEDLVDEDGVPKVLPYPSTIGQPINEYTTIGIVLY